MSGSSTALPRLVGAGGIVWGAVLLARGDDVWRAVEGRDPDEVERLATQVLAVRHQLQGLAQLAAPRATGGVVVTVDVLHAASMAALALASPARRRAALLTGGMAVLDAGVTALSRRRNP